MYTWIPSDLWINTALTLFSGMDKIMFERNNAWKRKPCTQNKLFEFIVEIAIHNLLSYFIYNLLILRVSYIFFETQSSNCSIRYLTLLRKCFMIPFILYFVIISTVCWLTGQLLAEICYTRIFCVIFFSAIFVIVGNMRTWVSWLYRIIFLLYVERLVPLNSNKQIIIKWNGLFLISKLYFFIFHE